MERKPIMGSGAVPGGVHGQSSWWVSGLYPNELEWSWRGFSDRCPKELQTNLPYVASYSHASRQGVKPPGMKRPDMSAIWDHTVLSGVPIQRKKRNTMTSLLDRLTADGSGQSQPPATTAYAAGMLPSCGRHTIKYEIIEIKFDLHHKLHNK